MKFDSGRYKSRAELRSVVFDFAHNICEWPQCPNPATELAHIVSSGMGGDPKHARDTVDNTFAACPTHARVSDGLPPPGGSYMDRNREYVKVPGVSVIPGGVSVLTRDVLREFAAWLSIDRDGRRRVAADTDGDL